MRFPLAGLDIPFDIRSEIADELRDLNVEAQKIERKRLTLLRDRARERGYIASDLADLRSTDGRPFVEGHGHGDLRMATVEGEVPLMGERAYWCGHESFSREKVEGCGWVLGLPRESAYDDIGMLSGSAGSEYHCKLCSSYLGREQTIVS